jgi:hypothetical protein
MIYGRASGLKKLKKLQKYKLRRTINKMKLGKSNQLVSPSIKNTKKIKT